MRQSKYVFRSYKFTILLILTSMCFPVLFCYHYNVIVYWILRPRYLEMMERNKMVFNLPELRESSSASKVRTLFEINEDVKNETKDLEETTLNRNSTENILWYNKPSYINLTFANNALQLACVYNNCRMFADEKNIDRYTAVIFSVTDPLDYQPPITVSQRNPNQVWIFFSLEPPVDQDFLSYRRVNWINTMNWSMSYDTESDIFFPYGILKARKETEMLNPRNYSDLFRSKTKQVAWIVSNCGAPSRRDEYVNELKKFGVEIEIFGKCGNKYVRDRKQLTDHIQSNFKFLLSFENNFCKDYISEKFFSFYNLDVILIVRGGGDYDSLLPGDTFINSAHFISPGTLADYIIKVGSSEKMFTDYLKNKDRYIASDLFSLPKGYCSLCEKLNNLDDNRITYVDHVAYRQNGSCWEPNDVTFTRITLIETFLPFIIFVVSFALIYICISQFF